MKCPWSCGWEGEPKDYAKHLLKCPKAKEKVEKHPTLGELFRGTVLNGYLEAARVKPLTEFAEAKPKHLRFTERVLGHETAANLRQRRLVQTIRSDKEIEGLKERDLVEITLDDKPVGEAYITSIDKVRLSELAHDDATRGGFSNLIDLQDALIRAGFRYKPFSEYVESRVLFTWKKDWQEPTLRMWRQPVLEYVVEKQMKEGLVDIEETVKEFLQRAQKKTKLER